ncbi:adenosine deaminase [Agarilytica rhodophyticola]|uniref:adenosine deaminase n=1 Tax=Agarilytica rhodophyticola TaxID=1737490 RepID=UPI001FEB38AD|nr:adenosine deaminase [Agarilytica rhodophyticola]
MLTRALQMGLFIICTQAFSLNAYSQVDKWFEDFKSKATDEQLYKFLYAMPKGGDLHNHLSGAGFPRWWYELAIAQESRGFTYYTKTQILNCRPYGSNEFGGAPYLLLFVNLQQSNYDKLSSCEKKEYTKLKDLNPEQKQGWLNSLKLDKSYEGRDEFFQTHWQRLNDLFVNHHIQAEILVRNMVAFGNEGLSYLEIDMSPTGVRPDGSFLKAEEVLAYYKQRLKKKDAIDSGVEVRFHWALLRFTPDAEKNLVEAYKFLDQNRDMYVALDLVGREDNDKGYPLRFLPTLRKLRHSYPDIELSMHAGEVDEPNQHIRDTLLLGANRVGHGVNLLSDPDTFLLMRHGPYLVEVNLVSNLLLEYVSDYSQHSFPEFLRLEVPVALSTDDRGMFDSNITDEFFVAVKEFNLSWAEVKKLSRNSLQYGYMDEKTKTRLLKRYAKRIQKFEQGFKNKEMKSLQGVKPVKHGFICSKYGLCG